jgi:hypothetical protein
MNLKNILLLVIFLFAVSSMNAAKLTVYNRMEKPVKINIVWFNKQDIQKDYNIPSNEYKDNFVTVDTGGLYPFKKLIWFDGPTIYGIDIPSLSRMLRGVIEIGANGQYSINFDKDGASDKKFTVRVATPVKSYNM